MATAIHETKPQTMEATITSGSLQGETVTMTVARNKSVFGETELTPEEMELLEAVVEASKRAEATAIRVGQTSRRLSEELRRSTAELRGERA